MMHIQQELLHINAILSQLYASLYFVFPHSDQVLLPHVRINYFEEDVGEVDDADDD